MSEYDADDGSRPLRHLDIDLPRLDIDLGQELEPARTEPLRAHGAHLLSEDAASGAAGDFDKAGRHVSVPVVVLCVLLAVVAGTVAYGWATVRAIDDQMALPAEHRAELRDTLASTGRLSEPFYALIIGSDARGDGRASRSDVIMLARVDTAAGMVTLVSIPRDTCVYDERGNVEKINAEYNRGPAATVCAVQELAGVPISHYVEVDFDGLVGMVDRVGGVTVTIPEDIAGSHGGPSFSAGAQALDGAQALAYARERKTVSGGDFGRAQAQRQIVAALARQVLAMPAAEVPGLVRELASCVGTDMTAADIASYALEFKRAGAELRVFSTVVPSYSFTQGGVSYVGTMYAEWRALMQRVDAGLDPQDATAAIPDEVAAKSELGSAANGAGPADYEAIAAGALSTGDVAVVGE